MNSRAALFTAGLLPALATLCGALGAHAVRPGLSPLFAWRAWRYPADARPGNRGSLPQDARVRAR